MNNKIFWELAIYNVRCNLKAEARNYAFGYLWWIVEPTLHLLILFFMLRQFFAGGDAEFVPFLFCGIVPWIWFSKSVAGGANSIFEGRHIIRDSRVNRLLFPTVSILRDFTREVPVLLVLTGVLLIMGSSPDAYWLQLFPVIILQFLLIASVVFLVAIITPYFPDIKYIIATGLQLIMFASGTFYDYKAMSSRFQEIFLLNPIAVLINMYRDVLMHHKLLRPADCLYIAGFIGGFTLLSLILYRKLDADLPKVLYR